MFFSLTGYECQTRMIYSLEYKTFEQLKTLTKSLVLRLLLGVGLPREHCSHRWPRKRIGRKSHAIRYQD